MFVKKDKNKYYYWNRQLDIHLIVGISRHGMWKPNTIKPGLAFDFIAKDPSLAFARIIGYQRAKEMFEDKRKHDELLGLLKARKAKEARKKYMKKKKAQEPEETGTKERKPETNKTEDENELKANENYLKLQVEGPSIHLPKYRVVERYLMALLIREYDQESGLNLKDKADKPVEVVEVD